MIFYLRFFFRQSFGKILKFFFSATNWWNLQFFFCDLLTNLVISLAGCWNFVTDTKLTLYSQLTTNWFCRILRKITNSWKNHMPRKKFKMRNTIQHFSLCKIFLFCAWFALSRMLFQILSLIKCITNLLISESKKNSQIIKINISLLLT